MTKKLVAVAIVLLFLCLSFTSVSFANGYDNRQKIVEDKETSESRNVTKKFFLCLINSSGEGFCRCVPPVPGSNFLLHFMCYYEAPYSTTSLISLSGRYLNIRGPHSLKINRLFLGNFRSIGSGFVSRSVYLKGVALSVTISYQT